MIKSILIAIKESVSSESALGVAIELGKITSAKIRGLYVEDSVRILGWRAPELAGVVIGTASCVPSKFDERKRVAIEKEMVEEGERLEKLFEKKLAASKLVGYFGRIRGPIDEMIVEAAKTSDLIVIGRGGNIIKEYSSKPGAIAESILQKTIKPVIVVPPETKISGRILIAYDGSETAQRALIVGATLATLIQPSIVKVISVEEDSNIPDKNLAEAREYLSPYKLDVSFTKGTGSFQPSNAIIEETINFRPGLIVLGAFGRNKLIKFIFGSTAQTILSQAKCPVLLCR